MGRALGCPDCATPASEAYPFQTMKKSQLQVYRCKRCQRVYNLYTGTVFEQRHLPPEKAVLLVRGVLKGEPTLEVARELNLHRTTIYTIMSAYCNWRRHWEMNGLKQTECFRTQGKKGRDTLT